MEDEEDDDQNEKEDGSEYGGKWRWWMRMRGGNFDGERIGRSHQFEEYSTREEENGHNSIGNGEQRRKGRTEQLGIRILIVGFDVLVGGREDVVRARAAEVEELHHAGAIVPEQQSVLEKMSSFDSIEPAKARTLRLEGNCKRGNI